MSKNTLKQSNFLRNKSARAKYKMATISIAMFLMLSMVASMMLSPTADAHSPPYQWVTYAKVEVLPNPIGVGQSALGYAFLGNAPPPGSAITSTIRFHDYTVIITDPDGKVQTLHWDILADTTGAQMFRFTPDVAGVWNITFKYGGQTLHYPQGSRYSSYEGDQYLPSQASCTLTVQQDPIYEYPSSYPLPTEYWTRPIYGENPYWFTVSSNWLGVSAPVISSLSSGAITGFGGQSMIQRYPGDAVGSLTSHVMWTKPYQEGGVVGGNMYEIEGDTYFEGSAYFERFVNPIIVYGRLFYREPVSFLGPSNGDSVCVDLRTGQEIWRRSDLPTISFAYIPDVQSPNQHGVFPALLCTSNFGQCYDMYTGENIFNVTGRPGGTLVMGPQGEHISYTFYNNGTGANPDWYICQWNSTLFLSGECYQPGADTRVGFAGWRPVFDVNTTTGYVRANVGNRYNYLNANTQNQSIPWRNDLASSFRFTVITAHYGDIMICINGSYPRLTGQTENVSGVVSLREAQWTYFAINLNSSKGAIGRILWWSPTYSSLQDKTITFGGADPTARVFIEACKETQNFVGYSYKDGSKLWETDSVNDIPQSEITPLDYFGNPAYPMVATQLAYGNVYSLAYGGVLFCYDLQTGKRIWSYGNGNTPGNSTDSGLQMPGPYPAMINAVGNGVIYTASTQHTIITPIPKGNMVRAINATDGTEIWTLSAYTCEFTGTSYAMADGYSVFQNGYDQQIYSVGKGPSATTVSIQNDVTTHGEKVLVKGTVIDVSAGTKQNEQAARFPNGVPAVSEESMTDWMGYVYQQKPRPADATGVEVVIEVFDPNTNYYEVGRTTSDADGFFSCMFTPEVPGKYTIIATFEGSEGYWSSHAETALFVEEAPAATPAPTPTPASIADLYLVPGIIGIIVAIAVVGAILVLMLRKR